MSYSKFRVSTKKHAFGKKKKKKKKKVRISILLAAKDNVLILFKLEFL